jgi:hypothetical protein
MCTHAEPNVGCIVDPIDSIALKEVPQRRQYVCKSPFRYVPQVPQEIIDMIVDNVEDISSFKACSLVCWAFVPISRTHIFHTVSLDMLNNAPHKLYAMLMRSPYIALYVRDLTIYRASDTDLWMEQGSPLPAVLAILEHVTRFSIFGCWGDWANVPPRLAAAILRTASLPRLDRLHILTVDNVPPALLQCALAAPVFSLFHVALDPRADPRAMRAALATAAPTCINLSLDRKVGRILEQIHAGAAADALPVFANVRHAALNPIPNSPHSWGLLQRMLAAIESTLERLDVQIHER